MPAFMERRLMNPSRKVRPLERGLPAALVIACLLSSLSNPGQVKAEPVRFAREVAPILERHCLRCHQPGNRKGELSLATFAELKELGHVVPGKPEESRLLQLVLPGDGGKRPRMPKQGPPLDAAEIAVLRRWIAEGGAWPETVVLRDRSRADASWWSLQPLAQADPPSPTGISSEWAAHPIDRFLFARLAERGLTPNPPADRKTLIRRLSYDLIGLPPAPAEIDAFVRDTAPDAYERLVERLLASPHHGEHWGRHWLDVVRFGESNGFERNILIPNLWPFRDHVIRSFNDDRPFDRLVLEHLAGDVLAAGDPAAGLGTAFLVCGPYDNVGNQDAAQSALIQANTADEIIRASSEAFLGLTVGCARCHDHKFDPITQQDYYSLYATFAGVRHGERSLAPPAPPVWAGRFEPARGPFHVFLGGDPQKKGEPVVPASLAALNGLASRYRLPADAPESARRQALAQWLVAADNPLTPRVLANRLWHYHFGVGLVDTPSDFGAMGSRPTHPELLDWLARQVHAHGWHLKPLHRLIVTSQAYRQSAGWREAAARVDGDNRYLWRFPPRRLTGEEVRDTLLTLAGKLDTSRSGGPGFRLYRYVQDNVATYIPLDEHGPETYRRSVYHQNARAARVDVLGDFDCPDPAAAMPRRPSSTTPLQALTLLNHRFTHDMARFLAERLEREAGTDRNVQVRRAFLLAYAREPDADEQAASIRLIARHGLRAFCLGLLNSNELIYLR
jgi:hypothetical protein